jgi:hypothetical protein
MKKEDYEQSGSSVVPVDIEFIPEFVCVEFRSKLKLQVAFFRSRYRCS